MSEDVKVVPAIKGRHGWIAAVAAGIVAGVGGFASSRINAAPAAPSPVMATAQPPPAMPPAATPVDVQGLAGKVDALTTEVRGLAAEVRAIQEDRTYQRGRADGAREQLLRGRR